MIKRNIREIPKNIPPEMRGFLQDVRETLLDIRGALSAPRQPIQFTGTAIPGGALLTWVMTDADTYEILWNSTPNISGASVVEAGNSGQWQDGMGAANVTRYYWLRAKKSTGVVAPIVGPVKVTSAALGAGVTLPVPPPASDRLVLNQTTNVVEPDKRQTALP